MSVSSSQSRNTGTNGANFRKEGCIDLFIGPVFAGKTTELLKLVRRNLAASKKCLLVKYKGDTRYGQEAVLITHDQVHMAAKSVTTLSEVENAAWLYDVLAIDEGQFFPGMQDSVTLYTVMQCIAVMNTASVLQI